MTWIAVLCIGVAVGWAMEFLLDLWFWGRRNRRLQTQLSQCRSNFEATEEELSTAREMVSQYRIKEDEYQKCQYDLRDLTDQHCSLEIQAEKMSNELKSSQQRIGQLDTRSSELKAELDRSHDTLEEVDRWIESSMRRRVWNAGMWKSGINRSKERSAAYVHSMASKVTSNMRRAAGSFEGRISTMKTKIGRTIDTPWLVGLFKRGYCNAWSLFGSVFKKSETPPSCSYNSK